MNLKAKAILGAVFLGALSSAQAQLSFEKTEMEFHPKATDAEVIANFKYENKGKKPIKITSVKSSCGCTVASSKQDEVKPGETGEVTANFKIGGRTGLQQKAITVTTDDPDQPTINLMLKADIPVALEIQPNFVFWENGEAPNPKTITVKQGKDVKLTTLDVTSSGPEFTTKVDKGSAPGEFKVTVTPKDTKQMLNATLTFKPDFPGVFYATARVIPPANALAPAAAAPAAARAAAAPAVAPAAAATDAMAPAAAAPAVAPAAAVPAAGAAARPTAETTPPASGH